MQGHSRRRRRGKSAQQTTIRDLQDRFWDSRNSFRDMQDRFRDSRNRFRDLQDRLRDLQSRFGACAIARADAGRVRRGPQVTDDLSQVRKVGPQPRDPSRARVF